MGNELKAADAFEDRTNADINHLQDSDHPADGTHTGTVRPTDHLFAGGSSPTGGPSPLTTESLVPRLGDSLVEAGVITPDQLQLALDYQKNQAAGEHPPRQGSAPGKPLLLGQALSELGFIDRDTLDQAIASRLVSLHEALQDSNRQLELRVSQRTEELERRIVEIRTAAEITQLAITTPNLDELLNRTVNLIADRFGYSQVIVFLIDPLSQYAVLREASGPMGKTLKETGYKLPVGSQSMVGWVAAHNQARVSANVGEDPFYMEEELLSNTKAEATLPLSVNDLGQGSTEGNPQVLGVLDVQHTELNTFDQNAIATLQTIANHIAATIYNIRLLEDTQRRLQELSTQSQKAEKRLVALQTLNTISQAVSIESDLPSLYRTVHHEVNQIMGEGINFIIALYEKDTNLINIPYMYEEHTAKSVDPFPLGEGLTSIIIRTRQPLMIVEDTEKRTRELGAIVLGAPAKSWMGVPLLIGGEAIGAMIVQDLEMEFRFDEDDLRLMSTLALQVAAGLRNARLLESTYRRAERDRLLHEISRKIRSSTEMQTILKTTAQELGKFSGARRVQIEIAPFGQIPSVPTSPPEDSERGSATGRGSAI